MAEMYHLKSYYFLRSYVMKHYGLFYGDLLYATKEQWPSRYFEKSIRYDTDTLLKICIRYNFRYFFQKSIRYDTDTFPIL